MPIPEIREVIFPPDVVEKLWVQHGLSQWMVEEVIYAERSEPRWEVDEEHGGRVIILGETSEPSPRTVFVALSPIDYDGGIWRCITAFCPTNPDYSGEE